MTLSLRSIHITLQPSRQTRVKVETRSRISIFHYMHHGHLCLVVSYSRPVHFVVLDAHGLLPGVEAPCRMPGLHKVIRTGDS